MPLAAVCWISITNGKASDTPASASGPSRPRNNPSNVIMPAIARRLRTLGADSRSKVGRIGPSSSRRVRAAIGRAAAGPEAPGAAVGAKDGGNFARLWSVMGAPPRAGVEQRLGRTVLKNRAAASRARRRFVYRSWAIGVPAGRGRKLSFLGLGRVFLMNYRT